VFLRKESAILPHGLCQIIVVEHMLLLGGDSMRNGGGCGFGFQKILAVILIAAGIVIILSSVPCWLWLAAIGGALAAMGVALLKAC
ncbi:MAG: hypothetical protein Q4D04_05180, partial [Clostridia bacterium]|nr:hypothetical protein [Clostridia bacterium]